jgi:hypothetical protein
VGRIRLRSCSSRLRPVFFFQNFNPYSAIIMLLAYFPCFSLDSSVGIATGYWLGDRRVRVRVSVGSRIFSSSTSSRPALGPAQLALQWVPGALSLGIKRPVREADHSSPTSAEVKKM